MCTISRTFSILLPVSPRGRGDLLELRCETRDLVVVRATLERRKDGKVDGILVLVDGGAFLRALGPASEEDHASARAAERLVRSGGDNIAILERALRLAGRHETADV